MPYVDTRCSVVAVIELEPLVFTDRGYRIAHERLRIGDRLQFTNLRATLPAHCVQEAKHQAINPLDVPLRGPRLPRKVEVQRLEVGGVLETDLSLDRFCVESDRAACDDFLIYPGPVCEDLDGLAFEVVESGDLDMEFYMVFDW